MDGIVNGSGMVTLFNFLKSTTILIPPSFFLTGNGELDHAECDGSMIPSESNCSISFLNSVWYANGIVYDGVHCGVVLVGLMECEMTEVSPGVSEKTEGNNASVSSSCFC